jgi:glycerol-3-phosphate acyltransferase PlsX
MTDLIKVAVDAMGGDNSPKKTIDGIILNHSKNKNVYFKIFGDEKIIRNLIGNKIKNNFYEIIHTTEIVKSTDSPLEGAKRGKNTSMWLAIESVKKKED